VDRGGWRGVRGRLFSPFGSLQRIRDVYIEIRLIGRARKKGGDGIDDSIDTVDERLEAAPAILRLDRLESLRDELARWGGLRLRKRKGGLGRLSLGDLGRKLLGDSGG
jgi:hypothetical protein